MKCYNPYNIKVPVRNSDGLGIQGYYRWIQVPCGKCAACLANKCDALAFRLLAEQNSWYQTLFVTFTYDPEHYVSSLSKDDAKLILRNLKNSLNRHYGIWKDGKLVESFKFRYFLCGEYGDLRDRPHYHLLLFLPKSVNWNVIQKCNPFGCICDISVAGVGSAYYIAKYSLKEVVLDKFWIDKERPFYLQSDGIGISFLSTRSAQQLKRKKDYVFRDAGGYLHLLPRYLREKMFNSLEREEISDRIADDVAARRPRTHQGRLDYNNRVRNDMVRQEAFLERYKKSLKQSLL